MKGSLGIILRPICFSADHPDSMKTKNLERSGDLVWGQTHGGGQEGMFWKLVPEDVIGKTAEFTRADYGFMWRVKEDKMEETTGVIWTESEWGPRTLQLREYPLTEFWDDRPFHSDSLRRHANVQSKAVFSSATTVLDKIHGWIDEEKWVGSKVAACMWIHTKMVLTEWRKPTPEMQEYLKRRMLSIMLCVNWVCAGTFDDHEWASESTFAEQEEDVIGRDLDCELCIPCEVQWSMLWFSAPTW